MYITQKKTVYKHGRINIKLLQQQLKHQEKCDASSYLLYGNFMHGAVNVKLFSHFNKNSSQTSSKYLNGI